MILRLRSGLPLLLLLLGLSGVSARAADEDLAEDVAALREDVAEDYVDLAEDLIRWKLRDEALAALAAAREHAPELEGLAELDAEAEALEPGREVDRVAQRALDKTRDKVAKAFDKIARLHERADDEAGQVAWLVRAARLDPSRRRLGRLAELAQDDLLLLTAPEHGMAAYVSLPRGWRPGRTWPVLVSVEGAGCNFLGNARGFRNARGSRDWITVAPHALSCTNALDASKYPAYDPAILEAWGGRRVDFDVPGLVAILDLVTELFGGAEKVAITGFSGGGNLCYGFVFHHPERVLAAAPACANFQPGLARGAEPVEDGGPPVHILTGELDPHRDHVFGQSPGIEGQSDWAEEAFARLGFTNVRRTMLEGVKHSSCAKQVWDFVDEVAAEDR